MLRQEGAMGRRQRRSFDAGFKTEAVRLCREGGRSIAQVAKDLDLTETALREWVRKAEAEEGAAGRSGTALTSTERAELTELRARVKRLEMERDILKKATAFFAKESR